MWKFVHTLSGVFYRIKLEARMIGQFLAQRGFRSSETKMSFSFRVFLLSKGKMRYKAVENQAEYVQENNDFLWACALRIVRIVRKHTKQA